jgi:hypothetical protein
MFEDIGFEKKGEIKLIDTWVLTFTNKLAKVSSQTRIIQNYIRNFKRQQFLQFESI